MVGSPWGGGGYLISGAALRNHLMAKTPRRPMKWERGAWVADAADAAGGPTVLDACISAKLGGAQCNAAMQAAGLEMKRADDRMQQVCQTTPPAQANVTCDEHMVTCHKLNAAVMRRLHDACETLHS